MRDIKRIDKICKKLAQLGKEYPDERFGQFILNHIFNDGTDPGFKEDVKSKDVPDNGVTGEEIINKQIEECKLFKRVINETNYEKDDEKYGDKYRKWQHENAMTFDLEKGKVVFLKKPKKPEPKKPDGRDYIKELK